MISETTKKLREPIAFGLIAVAVLYLVSGVSLLFKSEDDFGGLDFAGRAAVVGHVFADPLVIVSLAGAVLLATGWREATRNARSIVQGAIAVGAICLVLAVVCWIAGLTADRINAYGGVNGAGRIVGVFLGLAQIALLGLVLAYAATVLQAIPKPVRTQQQWATGQQAWGSPPQQSWGPTSAPYYGQQQPPQQPGQQGWQQPQQPWGQPSQAGPSYPQQWPAPPQQQSWGEAPSSTPPPGTGWSQQPPQQTAGWQQPDSAGWQQPDPTGWDQSADPAPSAWSAPSPTPDAPEPSPWGHNPPTPAHAARDEAEDTGSTWSTPAESVQEATTDDDSAADLGTGTHAERPEESTTAWSAAPTEAPTDADAESRDPDDSESDAQRGPDSGWWRGSSS